MSIWGNLYSSIEESAKDIGIKDVIGAYGDIERQRRGSFQNARAEQAAARVQPEVESQNRGDPVTVATPDTQKPLVGESEQAGGFDKKWLYIGGGALLLVAVLGIAVARK